MAGQPGNSPRGSAPRTGSASCSCPHRQVWMAGEESVPSSAGQGASRGADPAPLGRSGCDGRLTR